MAVSKPVSVTRASWAVVVAVALSGVVAVMTLVRRDELVLAWAEGNETAQAILADGGLPALRESSLTVPSFGPIAVVSFVVFAGLAAVLVAFLRHGHGWARPTLSTLMLFGALVALRGLGRDLPLLFVVLTVASLVAQAACLFFLWQRETTRYLKDV